MPRKQLIRVGLSCYRFRLTGTAELVVLDVRDVMMFI